MQTKNNAQNIESALNRLVWRFKNQNVKINESKIIVNEKDEKVALSKAKDMCEKLLANLTIEDYSVKAIKE